MKQKLPIIFCFFVAGLYLLLKFGFPSYAKFKAQEILSEELGERVTIQSIKWEPLLLTLSVEGISLNDKEVLQKLYVDLSYFKLFNKNIHFSKLEIDGVNTEIIKVDGKYQAAILKKVKNKKSDSSSELKWLISLNKFELKNSLIKLPHKNVLVINSIKANNLYSENQKEAAKLNINMVLNKSKIKMNGSVKNYLRTPEIQAQVKVSKLELSLLNQFKIKGLGNINGALSLDSSLAILPKQIEAKSQITLTDFSLYSEDNKIVNYSAKSIELKKFNFKKSDVISSTIETLLSDNLVLSIPSKEFKNRSKFSKFAKIQLKNTQFNMPLNQKCVHNKELLSFATIYNDDGKIKATKLCDKSTKKLTVELDSIDLVPLSETFEHSLSYQVESGKLNLDLKTNTKDKEVTGSVIVEMNHLSLDDSNERDEKIKNTSSLPLDTAISLIKDSKGRIEADLDISGNEDNPDFGFLAMLRKGIGSFILSKLGIMIATKAATQFVPMLLSSVPFSPTNAFYIAKGGFNFLTKPRFKDINFFPNNDDIKNESLKQINELATLLKKNKVLHFTICPIASTREGIKKDSEDKKSKEKVLDLANKRIESIKGALSKINVSFKQVIFCRPKVSDDHIEFGSASISF